MEKAASRNTGRLPGRSLVMMVMIIIIITAGLRNGNYETRYFGNILHLVIIITIIT